MTKRKTTRRALVMSLLSLLLCCSMLVGTTFAWFTDSVTSGRNKIIAGNLDVELYYQAEGQTDWTKVDENTNVFKTDTLWEPGHTEVVKLKVVNEGTLALKYQLGVNVAEETGSKNMDGEELKLSDYIKFAVIDGAQTYTRDQAVAAAEENDATALNVAYGSGTKTLQPDADNVVTMVVYMPTTVGNEANYGKDEAIPTIWLGLNLFATQVEAESDSFGNDYDAGAVYADETYVIDGTTTLADTLNEINAADDETVLIQLNDNISWETGSGIGSTPLVSEGAAVQELIIDAQGATFTATGSGVGPIRMANGGTLIIKNAKIVDESVSYAENSWEYGYLEFSGNVVFENCEFVNAVMMEGESAVFTDCTFNSNKDSEYGCWIANGDASFTRCTFSGARGLKTHEAYGTEVGTITVDACTFDRLTKKPGVAIGTLNADTTVTIKNSDFINCQPGDQGMYIYESDTNVTTFSFDCSQNNDVISAVVSNTAELIDAIKNAPEGEVATAILLSEGTYADDLEITVAALGSSGGDVVIKAAEGAQVVLTGTVTLGYRDQGTGAAMYDANVTFEGITFDHANAATHSLDVQDVKSLTLKNCTIIGDGEYGITSARGNGTGASKITGCTFENAAIQGLGNWCSGLVIEKTTFNNSRINIQAGNGVTVQNCTFNNTLTDANVGDSFYLIRSNSTPITVKDCKATIDSTVTVVATSQAKWYLLANRGTTNWTVENVKITMTDAALAQTELKVTACTSTGKINTTNLTVNGGTVQ